ncbi:MAG: general secretion pathway protein GspD [Planctomycetes bacterium]|nr:general secretion pathway protein GspD [Planctomycetota bacterium]
MKAICKVSIGCIALAITLQQTAFAESHSVITAIVSANAAFGQSATADEAARRREADKWLRQARQELEAGKPDVAEICVNRAEQLNANYQSVRSRFVDTPTKIRRDIAAVRGTGAVRPQAPSQRFAPASPSVTGSAPRSVGNATVAGRDQVLNQLTNTSKAQASEYLNRGRQALQQGDKTAALAWYQRAVASGVSFAPGEFSPIQFATELQRAGIEIGRIAQLQPASPFLTTPSDFAPRELDRLPPIKPIPSTADSAFEGSVVTNPTQLPGGPRSGYPRSQYTPPSSPKKIEAMRLLAQAQAALGRGDFGNAQQFAERANAVRVPDNEFTQSETRPWELLLQIRSQVTRQARSGVVPAANFQATPAVANGGSPQRRSPVSRGVYSPESDLTRNRYAQAEIPTPAARPPEESPGLQMYRQGLRALEAQDRDAALQLFRDAWQFQRELDPITRQELKDKLALLGQASNRPLREPSPLEEVNAQQELLRQQLFREITNETEEAREMVPTDPRGALQRVTQLRDRIAQAEVDPGARRQLLTIVDRDVAGIEAYILQNEGDIDLKARNREVVESIDRDRAETNEIQQKVAQLVEEFNDLLDEERHPEAEVVARQIRELDPDSPITRLVTIKSKMARRMDRNQWIADQKEDGVVVNLQDVDSASTLDVNDEHPITFGDKTRWDELSKSRLERLEMQQRRLSPAEMEIQNTLKKPVNVNFNSRPLKEVLETLATLSGVNIYADPQGLAAEGVTSDTPVNITLTQDISLRSALNLILEPLRLSYVIQNEVLRITSEQLRDSNVHPRVYNVADLVIPIPNFTPGSNMGLPTAIRDAHNALGYGGAVQPVSMAPMPLTVAANELQGGGKTSASALAQMSSFGGLPHGAGGRQAQSAGFGPGSMGGAALADFDTLIQLITSTIKPDTWDEVGGPGAIEPFPTNLSLVISQTQDVHEQIADLLEQLRRLQDLQVTIEVRFITLRDDFFERIGVDFDFDIDDNVTALPPDDSGPSVAIGLDPAGVPTTDFDFSFTQDSFGITAPAFGGFQGANAANFGFAILSDIEAFFLVQAATGSDRSNVLQAPKVTLFNGQAASVSDVSQRPFVTSLIPVVGDFAAAHQPVIVVLSEGTSLGVQAVVSSDRRFVRLTLVPMFSQIGQVEEFTFDGSTSTTNASSNAVDANGDPTGNSDNQVVTTEGTTVQLPTFSFTTVSTTVSVPDGGTVLLGGIKRLSEERKEQGVPMLNKIPYINRLFKNVGIGRDTTSLMLMVTPRIIIQEEEEEKLGIEITP